MGKMSFKKLKNDVLVGQIIIRAGLDLLKSNPMMRLKFGQKLKQIKSIIMVYIFTQTNTGHLTT